LAPLKKADAPIERKMIFPFYYAPGERMVHVVARIADEPGTLASLLGALGKVVNLVGTSSYSIGKDAAIFSGFGKAISASVTAKEIQEKAERVPNVRSCEVWESNQGLLVDRFHMGFQGGVGEPYLMFPIRGLSETFEGIVNQFGSGGETILYNQGLDYAKARAAAYRKMMGPHPENRVDELAALVGALGYGKSEAHFESSGRELILTSRECFECSTPTKNGRTCSFLRGMAAGIFSALFNRELVSEETKCRQRGDELCEFTLTAKDGRPLY
jgi:predicted hydrocarbon binding protein